MGKDEALMEAFKQFSEYRQNQPKSNAVLDLSDPHWDTAERTVDLPCGRKIEGLIPTGCLLHILSTTPHPKVGHPIFWKLELIHKGAERVEILASVDPLMLEATGLPRTRLVVQLKHVIKSYSENLPNFRFNIVVREEVQQVLGTITINGQPEDHNCGGDQ